MQDFIEELGLAGDEAPSTPGTTDTVKNLVAAVDSLSEVESKNLQRLAGMRIYRSLDDPTCQFQMTMVMSGMCKPTVGTTARLMRAMHCCIDRQTLSRRFQLDRPQQKMAVLADANHASDETTRKSMSCHHIFLEQRLVETQSARQAAVA